MIRVLMDALIAVDARSITCLALWWRRTLMNHVDISNVYGAMRTMLTFILVWLMARLVAIIIEEDVPSHVVMHFTTLGIGLIFTIGARCSGFTPLRQRMRRACIRGVHTHVLLSCDSMSGVMLN